MSDRVKHSLTRLGVLILIGAIGGCARAPYDPFQIPREEVKRSVNVIAFAPTIVSYSILEPARAKSLFEMPIVRSLEAAGFRVLDSSVWDSLWSTYGSDIGEIYDPNTREVDDERYDIVHEAVWRALAKEHGADAVAYLSISTVNLYAEWGSEVEFCGDSAAIYWPDRMEQATFAPATLVVAACLGIALYDLDERYLYGIRNGLEVLETYAEQTRALRPREDRFRDRERRGAAIKAVIGPIIESRDGTER